MDVLPSIKKNEGLTYAYGSSFDSYYKDHVCKCGSDIVLDILSEKDLLALKIYKINFLSEIN